MSLDTVRDEIGRLDEEIIALIAKRQRLAKEIAHLKFEARVPIHDETQKNMVLERAFNQAVESHINPIPVRQIFEILIEMSEERQRECSGDGNLP